MDDPVPIPELLRLRPETDCPTSSEHGQIRTFDVESQSVPVCPEFRGVRVFRDLLSGEEADELLSDIEEFPFSKAQSGKLKQHHGPRINFNKKRMNASVFRGLPGYAARIEARARCAAARTSRGPSADSLDLANALAAFETTDVFVLRYFERESSNLDFHVDDVFAYGELILDISLESDSVLSFLRKSRRESGEHVPCCVRVPLPARSLLAIHGRARFDWEHAVLPYDIAGRRTSVTLRTLQTSLRETEAGRRVVETARRPRSSI